MKNVLITGSNGMVGNLVLRYCLERTDVNKVTSITRKPTGIKHPHLREVIHHDFLDYSSAEEHFTAQDICFYCIGVYTGQVPKDEFTRITVDFTKAFGEILKKKSTETVFCFLSGQGADSREKSKVLFARDKGIAENFLVNQQFKSTHIFRPGYIYPVTKRVEPNFSYQLMRFLYKPVLSKIYPNIGISSEKLAKVMVEVGFAGAGPTIFENKDIRLYER